jgi:hypothetical protein
VEEEQYFTAGIRGTEAQRCSAAGARDERSGPVVARNINGSVLASTIHDDHLVILCLLPDRVEQRRE